MYGIFSSIYCFSNVTAGLITTFALGFFDPKTYFFIITVMGIIAVLFCFFFVRHISVSEGSPSLLTEAYDKEDTQQQILQATSIPKRDEVGI